MKQTKQTEPFWLDTIDTDSIRAAINEREGEPEIINIVTKIFEEYKSKQPIFRECYKTISMFGHVDNMILNGFNLYPNGAFTIVIHGGFTREYTKEEFRANITKTAIEE